MFPSVWFRLIWGLIITAANKGSGSECTQKSVAEKSYGIYIGWHITYCSNSDTFENEIHNFVVTVPGKPWCMTTLTHAIILNTFTKCWEKYILASFTHVSILFGKWNENKMYLKVNILSHLIWLEYFLCWVLKFTEWQNSFFWYNLPNKISLIEVIIRGSNRLVKWAKKWGYLPKVILSLNWFLS